MLDVLLGMAVEGVKNLVNSEFGHQAMHVAAHKAAHAIGEKIDEMSKHATRQKFLDSSCSPFCNSARRRVNGTLNVCPNCGVTFPLSVRQCWNCHTVI